MQYRLAKVVAGLVLLSAAAGPGGAQGPPSSPVLAAMRQELTRSMESLKSQPTPPYFLSYQITETHSAAVRGSSGTVLSADEVRRRTLDMDLRVGSSRFDNTHAVRGMPAFNFLDRSSANVPLEDNPAAIRRILWYQTDQRYKRAVEAYTRTRASSQVMVAPEDTSPDFSSAPPATYGEPSLAVRYDRAAWEKKIRAYTAPFARFGDIYESEAALVAEGETRWYVNSEGSTLQTSAAYYRLIISATTRADDGMMLPRYESFVASTPDGLPDDASVLRTVDKMITDLQALRKAPVIDAATAPAILSGRASGVFFHEVFGHRIEGHRQKSEGDAQTFKRMVGQRILPESFSVYSDPTQRRLGSTELAGYYAFDDEGVRARRVEVVTDGIFKSFLMSRSPIAGFAESNGHGRSQPGLPVVARQSNLVITSSRPVPRAELRRMLIEEIKKQGKPFGLIFEDIEGGFTTTERFAPNAFQVLPVMVYRVFPDGREELVRGVDLIGTPLTVFSRVLAAGNEMKVFNGVCGAESGYVPVSAASPDILLSQVEVQRKAKAQDQAPILPPPGAQRP